MSDGKFQRLQLDAMVSVRTSKELKEEFERVAKQIRMTTADAGRLAVWEFVEKYKSSTDRPEF